MTSPANQQNPISATNSTTATTATSYASAAGAPKKSLAQPPVVVGSSAASPAQNAKSTSTTPVNGKQAVAPAVPVPAVVRGSSNGHTRQSSVTMASTGPNSYVTNGGPVGGPKGPIQFGFPSPAMAHGTPQPGNSAPIPIPGGANPRVTTPAHSPAPIPQSSASGGRPPSGLAPASGQVTFGSLSSDTDRHMRQGSMPGNPNSSGAHLRRDSNHSIQSDHAGRGNSFVPQAGRGRGFNPNFNNQMGYPPNNQFRNGPGQGRGMPPSFQPQQRNMAYPNSPQSNHRSPALAAAMPGTPGTPNMPPANMQGQPQHHYPPPGVQGQYQVQPYQVNPPFSVVSNNRGPPRQLEPRNQPRRASNRPAQTGRLSDPARDPFPHPQWKKSREGKRADRFRFEDDMDSTLAESDCSWINPTSHVPQRETPSDPSTSYDMRPGNYEHLLLTVKQKNYGYPPGPPLDSYGRPYPPAPYMGGVPQANSPGYNQVFASPYVQHQHGQSMSRNPSQQERPPSANQQAPAVAMGSNKQLNSPAAEKFVVPKKSAAIVIKSATGEVLNTSALKAPSSPASHQTKTPPVTTSATPPPKASTPTPTATESAVPKKSKKDVQQELKEKILLAQKKEAEKKNDNAAKAVEPAPAASETKAEPKSEIAVETAAPEADIAEKKVESAPAPAPKEEKSEEPKKETEDEYMERMIREMEEADEKREKEQAELTKKKAEEKAAAKAKADAESKTSAAEEDKRLREQEREMERKEEEKEQKRKEAEKSGNVLSVAELLAGKKAPAEDKVDDVTDKLAGMKIAGDKSTTTAEKRGAKPAALNLAPLNTKTVEPPQPSAALQSLQSARFLTIMGQEIYPEGIKSPNPALNAAVAKKGKTFKYDANFLLQFQKVFTEQPSLEFGQQVKQLIGDSDRSASGRGSAAPRQGSRGGSNTPFANQSMGNFSGPIGARTLPSGTTSDQRFAISSGSMPRPGLNPINSFQRPGGAFPIGASMSRGGSQQSHMGPNSPNRQGSRNTRSRRGENTGAKEAQAAKTMPLTAGMEIKPIAVSSSGWKPLSLTKGPAASTPSGHLDPEIVQRKVKAALNKMTPENFDRISDQILVIASQSKDESDGRTLRQVIQLTFEKATDEAHWASMYAKFCKKMLETMSPEIQDERIKDKSGNIVSGGNLFRKYLLNRCQEEFERGWQTNLQEAKDSEDAEKKPPAPGEVTMLSDEYYKAAAAKRRGLGLVQFIGELYKLGMLTERIMLECVHKLVDHKGIPDEAEIESLSKLLRTIGGNLDMSEKGRPMMDVYFGRITSMMESPELPSRMKYMLMDVVDLRRANWHSKEQNKGPKTLEEVRAEAEAAQAAKAQESARNNQRGGGGRSGAGRGDARNFSGGYQQQTSNQVGMDDLRRLKGSANRTASGNVTLGPTSMFASRSNSGRGLGPGGSLGRRGEDSGNSSRTGTPQPTSHLNAFSLLANMETEGPTSPPTTAASPAMSKAVPDSDKKDE